MLLAFIFTAACKNEVQRVDNQSNTTNSVLTTIPLDTTSLWFGDGPISSDTVLMFLQGGPKNHLDIEVAGRSMMRYIPNYQTYYCAHLHQSHTLNKAIFECTNFTLEMAEAEINTTAEMIHRSVSYFKNKGKTVILFAHSYGAFLIPYYLTKYPSLADKYIITGGRLDVDVTCFEGHLAGYNGHFEEDGLTYVVDKEKKEKPTDTPRMKIWHQNKQLLKGVLGVPRYTELLKDVDMSNFIYFSAKDDQNVGALKQGELDFLDAKGAQVFHTTGGHYDLGKRLIDAFIDGDVRL